MTKNTRRGFMKQAGGLAGAIAMPSIIPARVLGQSAPSKLINIGIVGCGRISTSMEMPGVLKWSDMARITAICDLDSKRLAFSKNRLESDYKKKLNAASYEVKTFARYKDMLRDGNVDAVMVCVPDHWHALCAVDCAIAGKDIWLQKPFSQTIHEGRILSEVVRQKGVILQVGSQQRSSQQFRTGCELVRNGRVGRIKRVEVGFGKDSNGGRKEEMPVPPNLDYETWLGPTPPAYYTEDRVHDQDTAKIGSRPGWIQMEPYGWGMITNWGAHHMDIVQWGLGTEDRGPLEVSGVCGWLNEGLWNAHAEFDLLYKYEGGIDVSVCYKYPNGVRFIGDDGWIFVSRGSARVTASDPTMPGTTLKALDASDPKLLEGALGPDAVRLQVSNDHVQDWLLAIRSRASAVTNAEIGHRSTSVCSLGHMCMKTGKSLKWDYRTEKTDNAEANKLLLCMERGEFSIAKSLKAAGIKVKV
ncbi:MAG: Gfo/Idh/MocA family oxidoreductase [Kiritimatiellae bacterium]|nr:Gfo/Idh/MocA family oxidoreductase [Kiritimatiellia bacterium]